MRRCQTGGVVSVARNVDEEVHLTYKPDRESVAKEGEEEEEEYRDVLDNQHSFPMATVHRVAHRFLDTIRAAEYGR